MPQDAFIIAKRCSLAVLDQLCSPRTSPFTAQLGAFVYVKTSAGLRDELVATDGCARLHVVQRSG